MLGDTKSLPWRTLATLALILLPVSGGTAGGVSTGVTESTRRMGERLRKIAAESDPRDNPFMNGARARLIETALAQGEPPTPQILLALCQELLNAGRTADAITRLADLERVVMQAAASGPGTPAAQHAWVTLRMQQAVTQLRRGEEENCSAHHNPDSCLLPIQGAGVHTQTRGARAAVTILSEVLQRFPRHLEARWLLNLAYMTLGEYPSGVPSAWLVPPDTFKSEADIGKFPDVAGRLGLDVNDLAGGVILDDFDGDGDLDIMASAMGLSSPLRYFENRADGGFADRTEAAGLTGLVGGLNLVQTDYDNDGDRDALVLRGGWMGAGGHYPNSLLRNDGHARFSDVAEEAGILSYHPTQTAVWLDFDGDGWLDLFIGNESTPGDPNPNELYRNNADGTFTECAGAAGVAATGFVKGVAGGDYNNDGRPDLYLSLRGEPNRLYRNDTPGALAAGAGGARTPCALRFTDVAGAAGVIEPIQSFPTWFWDYDNDGWEDLFVSGYNVDDAGWIAADYLGLPHKGAMPRLYHNNGDGTFADATRGARLNHLLLTMGSNYGDLDNDGWLDFYAGTGNPNLGMLIPNRMFRNEGGKLFQDVTTSGGFGHLQKGHGVAFGDLDDDGDEDVYHVVGGAVEADSFRNALFENPGHSNHWISIALEGVRSNRPGIGARIKVVARTPRGERVIHRTVRSGGSFGASPLAQHIGLGDAVEVARVEILWPSGGPTLVVEGIRLDHHHLVKEGVARATSRKPAPFRLGARSGAGSASSH